MKYFTGWGNNLKSYSRYYNYPFPEHIELDNSYAIRGNGRSYGDSSLNERIVLMRGHNKIKYFDIKKGFLICESGITIQELNSIIIPKGWFLPVTPGTSLATLGGCVASDVHGKNHRKNGCISEHIISINLLIASGDFLELSREKNFDLFKATCGGMGLTGMIVLIQIKLMKINSNCLMEQTKKLQSFNELIDAFNHYQTDMYNVAWLDFLNINKSKKKIIFIRANHLTQNININSKKPLDIPFKKKLSFLMSKSSIKVFNLLYYYKFKQNVNFNIHYKKFFYILDSIKDWNILYGKKGFIQFHFYIPEENINFIDKQIFNLIIKGESPPYLSTIKKFKKENGNFLSFPNKGLSIALDFPNNDKSRKLIAYLECVVVEMGGRVYLTKDSLLSKKNFEKSYDKLHKFLTIIDEINPKRKFRSFQSDRLGLS